MNSPRSLLSSIITLIFFLLLFVAVACQTTELGSPLSEFLVGKWELDHRRFTNSVLEFKSDGTLIISDSTNNQVRATIRYRFVKENEIEIIGAPEFQSTATLEFRNGKLCATFIFEGNVFGEIFPCMTRIE